MEITKRREIFFLSELRAIACIAIVILHTFYAASVYAPDHTAKIAALTTRNLMMWAVPCFVMVSGALLLDSAREDIPKVYPASAGCTGTVLRSLSDF